MDLVTYSAIEAGLAAQGLAIHAGLIDQIAAYRWLIIAVFGATFIWLLAKGAFESSLDRAIIYMVLCVAVWFAIPVRFDVNVEPKLPPEQTLSEQQKTEVEASHGVNFAFAFVTKLLDYTSNLAAEQIAHITTTDGYVRVTGSYAEGVTQLLMAKLPEDFDTKTDLHDFLIGRNSCRDYFRRYVSGPPEAAREHVAPFVMAMLYMVTPPSANVSPKLRKGYDYYQRGFRQALDHFHIPPMDRAQMEWCVTAPEQIRRQLFPALAADLSSGKVRASNVFMGHIGAAATRFWSWLIGHDQRMRDAIMSRILAREVFSLAAPTFVHHGGIFQEIGRFLSFIKDKWGVAEGTAKVALALKYAPMVRGVAKMLLFAVFPFLCLFLFLPSGWGWMKRWFRLLVAVYFWQILDFIALSVIDNIAWQRLSAAYINASGVNIDPQSFLWVQSLLLLASPAIAYLLSGVSGGLGLESAISGPGIGGAARVAASGLRALRRR